MLTALDDRQEVIAGQLAGKHGGTVGKENFRLAVAARIQQDLAGSWVAGVVLESHAHLAVAQRNPGCLPAPACLNDLVAEGQQRLEGGARPWRALFLEPRRELERAG